MVCLNVLVYEEGLDGMRDFSKGVVGVCKCISNDILCKGDYIRGTYVRSATKLYIFRK